MKVTAIYECHVTRKKDGEAVVMKPGDTLDIDDTQAARLLSMKPAAVRKPKSAEEVAAEKAKNEAREANRRAREADARREAIGLKPVQVTPGVRKQRTKEEMTGDVQRTTRSTQTSPRSTQRQTTAVPPPPPPPSRGAENDSDEG